MFQLVLQPVSATACQAGLLVSATCVHTQLKIHARCTTKTKQAISSDLNLRVVVEWGTVVVEWGTGCAAESCPAELMRVTKF